MRSNGEAEDGQMPVWLDLFRDCKEVMRKNVLGIL
jgi:hypothetical protein